MNILMLTLFFKVSFKSEKCLKFIEGRPRESIVQLWSHLLPFQGSVVVFSANATWTFDAGDKDNKANYCAEPAFLCAFVLLILQWVKSFLHSSSYSSKPLNLEFSDLVSIVGLLPDLLLQVPELSRSEGSTRNGFTFN